MGRERRSSYLLDRYLPRVVTHAMPVRVQKALLREENVVREEARYYDLYKSVAATGSADGTKWAHETEALLAQLARHDVRVAGQEVLDISGGPGFLARDLSSTVKRVVVTEYSDESVEGMRAALGLDVRKYDFNNDELHARVDGTFDVVLIRYSINFCQNLGAFGRELRRVMRPGGFVWVSFVLPTLGCCLRWMHDEYTYHALYSPETLHAAFAEADFTLVARETEPRYRYTAGRGFGVNALSVPYLLSATLRPTGSYNRELIQKNLALLFRADGAG